MDKKAKLGIIIGVSAAVIVAAVIFCIVFFKKPSGYRLLKVFEVEGKANVNRDKIGDIEPYANMVLESGDKVSLDTGNMTIQADDDKYIHLEEHTELSLVATGNSKKGKIDISLDTGAITNDIQNKLPGDSSYEINTPNSTMAVRGTIYRVYVYEEDGIKYTRVSVFDGKVAVRLVYKNGEVADEEVLVEKGKEVIIYEDENTTDYLYGPDDIDYDTLSEKVLLLLKGMNEDGKNLPITNPEIKVILEGPYLVSFIHNGKVFGTQTVKKGEKAVEPVLKPEESGSWQFDFSTPINRNTEIKWE